MLYLLFLFVVLLYFKCQAFDLSVIFVDIRHICMDILKMPQTFKQQKKSVGPRMAVVDANSFLGSRLR